MLLFFTHLQRLCIDLLTKGHVNAFQEFFFLTHEKVNPSAPTTPAGSPRPSNAFEEDVVPQNDFPESSPMEIRPSSSSITLYQELLDRSLTLEVLSYLKEHLSDAEHALRTGSVMVSLF